MRTFLAVAATVLVLSGLAFASGSLISGGSSSSGGSGGFVLDGGTSYANAVTIDPGPLNVGYGGIRTDGGVTAPTFLIPFTDGGSNASITYLGQAGNAGEVLIASSGTGAVLGIKNTLATGFSGVEYIDNTGALAVFSGFNNGVAGQFRFNNVATAGHFNFMIGGVTKLAVLNSGETTSAQGFGATTYLRSTGVATGSLPSPTGLAGAMETDTTLNCMKYTNGVSWSQCIKTMTAPITPVACTSPAITNGTMDSFEAAVGTTCAGVSTFVFTAPTAGTGWRCTGDNITASATRVLRQTAGWTGTTITMTNFAIITDVAADFADNAALVIDCTPR